jgi:hypothetical protein
LSRRSKIVSVQRALLQSLRRHVRRRRRRKGNETVTGNTASIAIIATLEIIVSGREKNESGQLMLCPKLPHLRLR